MEQETGLELWRSGPLSITLLCHVTRVMSDSLVPCVGELSQQSIHILMRITRHSQTGGTLNTLLICLFPKRGATYDDPLISPLSDWRVINKI